MARRAGQAEAGHVETDDAVIAGHGLHPAIPGMQRGHHAMNHHQHRAIGIALIAVMHIETVQLDIA